MRLKWKLRVFLTAALALLLCGCSTTELEERGFPLALGIDKAEGGIIVSFDFPDLTAVSDGKNPSGKPVSLSVEAGAYYEAQKAYENNTNKVLDYNHLKAVILSQEFLADQDGVRDLFAWLEGEEVLARNTCLFLAKDSAAALMNLSQGTSGSVGAYLEQMVETQKDFKDNKIMTIGKLMNQWHNQNELLLIPVLSDNGGTPSITEYGVVDAFQYMGNISVEEAMQSFLTQGLLKSFQYRLEDETVLDIQDISTGIKVGTEGDRPVATVEIKGDAAVKKAGGGAAVPPGQMKKHVQRQLKETLTETGSRLLQAPGMDLTNSFRLLGGVDRDLYRVYLGKYQEYRQNLVINFEVEITMLNE